MAVDKQSLEFLEATKEFKRASSTLNAASKQFTSDGLLGTGINKIADKIGAKGAVEFITRRRQLKVQDKLLKQELGLGRGQLKELKKRQKIAEAEEQRQRAFKSLSENLLGLSEQQRQKLVSIKESKDRGDGRDSGGKFVGKMTPEKVISGALKEANKENAKAAKKSGKSPGDKNRAAEEERTADQQSFEIEKTESTNDILRDILAALTGDSPLKKDEKNNGGILAGLGAGAGLANLLGSLGKLGKLLLLGSPLLLGLGALAYGLSELSDMADEVTKKVVDGTQKQTKAIEDAKTAGEAKEAIVGKENRRLEQERKRQRDTMTSKAETKALLQSGADKGKATLETAEKFELVKNSQSFNDIIKNTAMVLNAARDASIRDGNTIEARYASFDKVLAETIVKIKGSKTFLDADEKTQSFMIGQVVAQANKALVGAGNKSVLLSGLSPEAMKGQAAIETTRARALAALAGARGKFAEEGFGYLSDRLGGGRNTFSKSQVESLEARAAEAKKNADEVTWWERNLGSNQGDIDRLNSLTQELARLRDAIATVGGNTVVAPNNSVNTVTNSSASVSTPIYMNDQSTKFYDMF